MTSPFQRMPPEIAELPRDQRGYPVPWFSDWTSRSESPLISRNARIGVFADCTCQIGQGEPILGEPCVVRAREAVIQRRCSTCGIAIRPGSDMVWPSHTGDVAPYFLEPPNHPGCLEWALQVCPHLVGANRSDPRGLLVVTARRYDVHQVRRVPTSMGMNATQIINSTKPAACRAAPGYLYGFALTLRDPRRKIAAVWLGERSER